jgi:hypothetical protein
MGLKARSAATAVCTSNQGWDVYVVRKGEMENEYKFLSEILKERDHLENLGVNGRIMFKSIRNRTTNVWTGFISLRIGTSGSLGRVVMNFGHHKRISLLAGWPLLASQEALRFSWFNKDYTHKCMEHELGNTFFLHLSIFVKFEPAWNGKVSRSLEIPCKHVLL